MERRDTGTEEPKRRYKDGFASKKWKEPNPNPEQWDTVTWRAYTYRLAKDREFEARAQAARMKRFAWVEATVRKQNGGRKVGASFTHDLWVEATDESFVYYRRPDPLADGWTMPKGAPDSIANLIEASS